MGWSCSASAANRMDAINRWCYNFGGLKMNGSWIDPATGESYFIETSRKEHADGSITGAVNKNLPNNYCRKVGTFKISGDGKTFRGPAILKAVPFYEISIDGDHWRDWNTEKHGTPTDAALEAYIAGYAKAFEAGGVNFHVSKALGHVPYPNKASVRDGVTGAVVASWKAAMFQVWA